MTTSGRRNDHPTRDSDRGDSQLSARDRQITRTSGRLLLAMPDLQPICGRPARGSKEPRCVMLGSTRYLNARCEVRGGRKDGNGKKSEGYAPKLGPKYSDTPTRSP
ncbi:hypothetical protein ALC56_08575 [Trachymyrmex septentrionalis]|uniref:Uncharacterized protein n=1 Tax=Trachymyrmex septentrionalis TaxID=34720 RepID=A0A195F9Q8_9HYME|nr:hypothetical protein ALC56_08575 [Trachymyrmex septentrionalis]